MDLRLRGKTRVPKKEKSVACSWHPDKGKGSHGVLKYGNKRTTLRNLKDELKTGTYYGMLKQLGLTNRDPN
jgi:mRNA interferase HicA